MPLYKNLHINKQTTYLYNPDHIIGWGSYAEVFRGKKSDSDTPVAIKVVDKARAGDNWHAEALIHQKVNCNPNIVKLLDIFQSNTNLYLVTEFCEGRTLRDKLNAEANGRLSEDVAVEYMAAMVDALCTIHGKGIMHRDIKPENMFFKDGKIKLGDFGSSTDSDLSVSYKGTLEYLAPEIMKDEIEYKKQIDVWSLGIVFYEMLYGEKPYKWNNEKQIFEELKVNRRTGKPLDECHISKEAKGLLKEMFQVDPEKRITIEQVREHPVFKRKKEEEEEEKEDDGKIPNKNVFLIFLVEYCLIVSVKDGTEEDNKEVPKLKEDIKTYLKEIEQEDDNDVIVVDEDLVNRLQ